MAARVRDRCGSLMPEGKALGAVDVGSMTGPRKSGSELPHSKVVVGSVLSLRIRWGLMGMVEIG